MALAPAEGMDEDVVSDTAKVDEEYQTLLQYVISDGWGVERSKVPQSIRAFFL